MFKTNRFKTWQQMKTKHQEQHQRTTSSKKKHANLLRFTPPGFCYPIDIIFPPRALPVCDRCKSSFKTRESCRERDCHTSPPWSETNICISFDDTCSTESINNNEKLFAGPYTTVTCVTPPISFNLLGQLDESIPICGACKERNYTRHHCRNVKAHRQLPWGTVYVICSLAPNADPLLAEDFVKKQHEGGKKPWKRSRITTTSDGDDDQRHQKLKLNDSYRSIMVTHKQEQDDDEPSTTTMHLVPPSERTNINKKRHSSSSTSNHDTMTGTPTSTIDNYKLSSLDAIDQKICFGMTRVDEKKDRFLESPSTPARKNDNVMDKDLPHSQPLPISQNSFGTKFFNRDDAHQTVKSSNEAMEDRNVDDNPEVHTVAEKDKKKNKNSPLVHGILPKSRAFLVTISSFSNYIEHVDVDPALDSQHDPMLVKKILDDFTKKRISSTFIDNNLSQPMSHSVTNFVHDVHEKVYRERQGMNDTTYINDDMLHMMMSQRPIPGNRLPGNTPGPVVGMNNVMNDARSAAHRNMMERYMNDTLRFRVARMIYYEQKLLNAHERHMMDLQRGGYRRDGMYSNIGLNLDSRSNNSIPIRGFYQPDISDFASRSHPMNAVSNRDSILSNPAMKDFVLRERMLQEIMSNMNNSSTIRGSQELLGVNTMMPSDHGGSRAAMNDTHRANLTSMP